MSLRVKKYSSNLSFVDILFNMLLGFIMLFVIAFILINPPDPNKKVEPKAEFLITMDWPDTAQPDIDLWVKVEPTSGTPIYTAFPYRQNKYAHLDRDDLGRSTDITPINREVTSIRSLEPAVYTVAIHYYRSHGVSAPVEVVVEIVQLNPYKIIITKKITILAVNDEKTIIQFRVNEDKSVTIIDKNPEPFTSEVIEQYRNGVGVGGEVNRGIED